MEVDSGGPALKEETEVQGGGCSQATQSCLPIFGQANGTLGFPPLWNRTAGQGQNFSAGLPSPLHGLLHPAML